MANLGVVFFNYLPLRSLENTWFTCLHTKILGDCRAVIGRRVSDQERMEKHHGSNRMSSTFSSVKSYWTSGSGPDDKSGES